MNLAQYIERSVEQFPSKIAIRFGQDQYTYDAFWSDVNRFGNGLRSLGIRKGDRVAMMLPNCPEVLIAHWAAIKLGGTFTPINTMFKEKELKYVLNNSGARVVVTSTQFLPLLENVWVDCGQLEHLILIDDAPAGTVNFKALMDASQADLATVQCDPAQTADLY